MKLLWYNIADTATITVSPAAVSTLPVTNLQLPGRSNKWRSTGLATQVIRLTWSTPQAFNAAVLYRSNGSDAATWRIEGFSDAAWTTGIYDNATASMFAAKPLGDLLWGIDPLGCTVFSGWALSFAQLFLTSTYYIQSMQITISDPANSAGWIEAARLYLGAAWESGNQFSLGLESGWKENTRLTRTDGGTLRSDGYPNYRELAGDINKMGGSDRAVLAEILRRVGMRTDLFVTTYPGVGGTLERDHAFAAKVIAMPSAKHDWPSRYSSRLSFGET